MACVLWSCDVTEPKLEKIYTNPSRMSQPRYIVIGVFPYKVNLTPEERQELMRKHGQKNPTIIDIDLRPRPRTAIQLAARKSKKKFSCGCKLCDSHAHARRIRQNRDEAFKNAPKERACSQCGFSGKVELDHINPVSKGGDNSPENLQWLCPSHHKEKTRRGFIK